jgi:F-type H+-transporting ATPase subunit a
MIGIVNNTDIMMNYNNIISPLEQFEINNFISLNMPIMGYMQLSITNFGLYTIMSFILIIGVLIFTINKDKILINE